jgi:hypothetical protein
LPRFESKLGEVHIVSLEGLGASYRIRGYFKLKVGNGSKRIPFKGVAFGGHYGGHNVNVELSKRILDNLRQVQELSGKGAVDELLSEVQRRILNGEMVVEYDKLRPANEPDPFGKTLV